MVLPEQKWLRWMAGRVCVGDEPNAPLEVSADSSSLVAEGTLGPQLLFQYLPS